MKDTLPDELTARVIEGIKNTNILGKVETDHVPGSQSDFINERLVEALDRDFASRYERVLQRSVFPELHRQDEIAQLAVELLDTQGTTLSAGLRRKILLRAARSTAIKGSLVDARRFLEAAQNLSGPIQNFRHPLVWPSPMLAPTKQFRCCAIFTILTLGRFCSALSQKRKVKIAPWNG